MIKHLLKTYFIAGLLVLVPIIVTILILKAIIVNADGLLLSILPRSVHPESLFGMHVPGLGLVATLALILVAGFFARLYIGKKAIDLGDLLISKIPLGRTIYSSIKQLMDTLLSKDDQKFKGVVVIEYPRKDCYVLGFLTGEPVWLLQNIDPKKRWVNVFVPTTPNPTSGFWVMVPDTDLHFVNISTEYAFKLIMSAGLVQDRPKTFVQPR